MFLSIWKAYGKYLIVFFLLYFNIRNFNGRDMLFVFVTFLEISGSISFHGVIFFDMYLFIIDNKVLDPA